MGKGQRFQGLELIPQESRTYLRAPQTGRRRSSHRRASRSPSATHRRRSRSTGRNGGRADRVARCHHSR